MATLIELKWTVSLTIGGICIMETDATMVASVLSDGEVWVHDTVFEERNRQTGEFKCVSLDKQDTAFSKALHAEISDGLLNNLSFLEHARDEAGLTYRGLGGNDPDGHFVSGAS